AAEDRQPWALRRSEDALSHSFLPTDPASLDRLLEVLSHGLLSGPPGGHASRPIADRPLLVLWTVVDRAFASRRPAPVVVLPSVPRRGDLDRVGPGFDGDAGSLHRGGSAAADLNPHTGSPHVDGGAVAAIVAGTPRTVEGRGGQDQ